MYTPRKLTLHQQAVLIQVLLCFPTNMPTFATIRQQVTHSLMR
jgi:hypothetical protein